MDRDWDDLDTWQDRRGYRLSDRIWQNGQMQRTAINDILRQATTEGATVGDAVGRLTNYVSPQYQGRDATYPARRLIGNEVRTAHTRTTVWAAERSMHPVKYSTSPGHAEIDECDGHANRPGPFGPGTYLPQDAPMPPVHIGCLCNLDIVTRQRDTRDMTEYAQMLRAEYRLDERPSGMSLAQAAWWDRETARIKREVMLGMRGWHEQTGMVSLAQMRWGSGPVRQWMNGVRAANGMAPLPSAWRVLPRSVNYNRRADLAGLRGGRFGEIDLTAPQWKPVMAADEAAEWAAGSAYTDTFYHATERSFATAIRREGFRIDPERVRYGRVYGRGVYLGDAQTGMTYRKMLIGNQREVSMLRTKVRLDRAHVLEIDARYPPLAGNDQAVRDVLATMIEARYGVPGKYEQYIDEFYKAHRIKKADRARYRSTASKEAIERLADDTDLQAIRIIANPADEVIGGNQVVVFDTKRVTVLP